MLECLVFIFSQSDVGILRRRAVGGVGNNQHTERLCNSALMIINFFGISFSAFFFAVKN
jgi:hypothetical protein